MRLTATLLLTVIYSFSNAQNWSPVTVFPGPEVTYRRGGISVSIGNKGYIGLGLSGTILKDFWEFNALTNTWTRLPDFPGQARYDAVAFVEIPRKVTTVFRGKLTTKS
jgi:N-acetylneuraminic acid mutarotase